jgi:hypothetical protein
METCGGRLYRSCHFLLLHQLAWTKATSKSTRLSVFIKAIRLLHLICMSYYQRRNYQVKGPGIAQTG